MNNPVRRSWLVVPMSKTDQIAQASDSGTDAIVLDLVELVAEEDKPAARRSLKAAIGIAKSGGAEVFAQVDPELLHDDLDACIWPGLAGIVVSRVESSRQIEKIATLVSRLEKERGIAADTLKIIPALETARGNHAAYDIGRASERVWGMTLGRADLVMDLRPEPSGELHLLLYLMQRLITVARAIGLTPLGAWWRAPDRGLLATPDNTYQAAVRGRAIGFKGAMCLRPNQVEPLNRGFTPSAAEMDAARRMLSTYQDAVAQGRAFVVQGECFVDRGAATRAQSLLSLADACAAHAQAKAVTQRAP